MTLRKITVLAVTVCCILYGCSKSSHNGKLSPADQQGQNNVKRTEIILGTLEWPPYTGRDLPGGGIACRILSNIFALGGVQVQIAFYPWARAINLAKQGKIDAVFPAYYSKARSRKFAFPPPYSWGAIGLFQHSSSKLRYSADPRRFPHSAVKKMSKLRLGLVRGYVNPQVIEEGRWLKKEYVTSIHQNILKLAHRRLDLIVADRYVVRWLLQRNYPHLSDQLAFIEPPLAYFKHHLAVLKSSPNRDRIITAYQKGLHLLRSSGQLRNTLERDGFYYPENSGNSSIR